MSSLASGGVRVCVCIIFGIIVYVCIPRIETLYESSYKETTITLKTTIS